MNKRDYAEINGALNPFYEYLEEMLSPGRLPFYSSKDKVKLRDLQNKLIDVQDHFWSKSRTKKELKAMNEVPKCQ